jgi:hypothetical protein
MALFPLLTGFISLYDSVKDIWPGMQSYLVRTARIGAAAGLLDVKRRRWGKCRIGLDMRAFTELTALHLPHLFALPAARVAPHR